MKAPCKNCEDRHVGCHSDCVGYKIWLEEYNKVKEIKHKEQLLDFECRSYIINDIQAKKKRNRKTKQKKEIAEKVANDLIERF